jgi:hypothetical protein
MIFIDEFLKYILGNMVYLEPINVSLLLDFTINYLKWLFTILIDHTLDSWL